MDKNVLVKWCRICYSELSTGLNLFGEEARRSFLHAKIRKYLSLTISVEDNLPKMICTDCYTKLDGFHKFATMALRNQEKMTKVISSQSSTENSQTETKSLLHTYLTKGVKKEEDSTEAEVTEVEVKIDPMMILQCCLEPDEDTQDAKPIVKDEFTEEPTRLVPELTKCENLKSKKPYACNVCPRRYTSELALQNHMWSHSPYPKRILNLTLYNNVDRTYTYTSMANGKGKNTESDDKASEEDEEDSDDSDEDYNEQKCPCPICGKVISSKGNLKVHLETHRPKGKYGCDICGRIFKTQCNLYRHKEYHEGVQYTCEVCGRVYPTNSTLRAHSITHSDLRPHECPMCDKTFKRNQDLKFHINQHTGARPYRCPYCPKAFASSGNCFSHRKRMHPMEVERDREKAAKIMR
nr:unnamed protein product [Callosobruchus analis]